MHVPSRALLRAGLIALVGSLLIVAFLVVTRGQRVRAEAAAAARASSRAPASVAPAPLPSAPRATPSAREANAASNGTAASDAGAPVAAASARVPDGKGDIVPPRSAAGHRVFVDGAQVGEGTHAIRVDCGDHRLRIGSGGKEHLLAVPCGETIELR